MKFYDDVRSRLGHRQPGFDYMNKSGRPIKQNGYQLFWEW